MSTAGVATAAGGPARAAWDVQVRLHVDRRAETPGVERLVRRKVAWLRRHFPELESCRVTVDVPHHRQRSGRLHRVRIALAAQGAAVRATRSPALSTYEDPLVAVHDAFAAAHRELGALTHRPEEERRTR
ncbi:MAG: HPF/RaiA family ribosome-associated protein [Vicinamibacteria bacterium]